MPDILSEPPSLERKTDLRRGIELLYFGYRDFTSVPDAILARHGLGRAHHRALYFIGRKPGLIVSDLLGYLKITKQSLARVLGDLQQRGLVETRVGTKDRRQRSLHLTHAGLALEHELFEATCRIMQRAYAAAGETAVAGFWQVLMALVTPAEQASIETFITNRS